MAITLSDETIAKKKECPPCMEKRIVKLETWKQNIIEWLKEQVGNPPEE